MKKNLLALSLVAIFCAFAFPSSMTSAQGDIEIWWPSNGSPIDGVQPFKAVLSGKPVEEYYLFWQVDGGGYVWMDTNYEGYPHKEVSVDVSGWNWNSSGKYRITFIAQNLDGSEITKKSITITKAVAPEVIDMPVVSEPVQDVPEEIIEEVTDPNPVEEEVLVEDPIVEESQPDTITEDVIEGDMPVEDIIETEPEFVLVVEVPVIDEPVDISEQVVVEDPVPVYVPEPLPISTPPISVGKSLYINQNSSAIMQAQLWGSSRPDDARVMERLGKEGSATWLGGWNGDVEGDVRRISEAASNQNAVATFVAYNIPNRDCGSYSAGGVSSKNAYISWITGIASGIGSSDAIVILEPDALAGITCLSDKMQKERYQMLSSAVDILSANKNTKVYLDAGHAEWVDADDMSKRLMRAGISQAAGFSLNVSNFIPTDKSVSYGSTLSSKVNGAHFVVDTSRNGSGSNGEWCNPSGRSLGQSPTLSTGNILVDAFLWIKTPGESDGTCNGGPSAGAWWAEYALALARKAGY